VADGSGEINFADLQLAHGYSPAKAYSQSKLANTIFRIELDRRLRAVGSPILSLLAHSGYSATNLQSTGPTGIGARVMNIGNALIAQNADRIQQVILGASLPRLEVPSTTSF
jgi:hypothetical protein